VRTLPLIAITTLAASAGMAAAADRTLTLTQPAAGITEIVIQGGVGDVEFLGQDAPSVDASVDLSTKHSSFWGSSRSREVLDSARLTNEVRGSTLYLSVETDGDSHDRDLSEDWSVRIPRSLAVRLKLGVGDVKVIDTRGDINVKVGVGDVRVEGSWSDYGDIRASCGVGDAELRGPDGREEGGGFIGHSLRSRGAGKAEIEVHCGVGDTTIKLR